MSARILYDSRFEPTIHGHGGNHRTLQIVSILRDGGYDVDLMESQPRLSRRDQFLAGLKEAATHRAYSWRHAHRTLEIVRNYGAQALRFQRALANYERPPVLVWEVTRRRWVPELARAAGFHLIAAPQNMEAMVDDQGDRLTAERMPASFEHELSGYRTADAVFTISREEQWLLALRGVEADYLPTYPAPELRRAMLEIRARRAQVPRGRFLVLGTAKNPPTRAGMIAQLRTLAPICETTNVEIDVAGFGTETLRDEISSPRIHVQGSVSENQLGTLLASTRGILIHQLGASGALTRIPEMLVAGIPIIGNFVACRSAYGYSGVHVYESDHELAALLLRRLEIPDLLEAPRAAERRFLETVERLVVRGA